MNMNTSPGPRHSRVVMLLHWLIAILVIVNWRLAAAAEHASKAQREGIMSNHFAIGVTVLILTLLLIGWKLTHKSPPLAAHLKAWEVALARVVHTLFYILLMSMPILGWVAMSSYGESIDVFGIFTLPALPIASNPDAAGTIFDIHATLGTILVILIGLHILGTVKHTVFDRDGNLFRMLPFGQPKA